MQLWFSQNSGVSTSQQPSSSQQSTATLTDSESLWDDEVGKDELNDSSTVALKQSEAQQPPQSSLLQLIKKQEEGPEETVQEQLAEVE